MSAEVEKEITTCEMSHLCVGKYFFCTSFLAFAVIWFLWTLWITNYSVNYSLIMSFHAQTGQEIKVVLDLGFCLYLCLSQPWLLWYLVQDFISKPINCCQAAVRLKISFTCTLIVSLKTLFTLFSYSSDLCFILKSLSEYANIPPTVFPQHK